MHTAKSPDASKSQFPEIRLKRFSKGKVESGNFTFDDGRSDGQSLAGFELGGKSQQFALFGYEGIIHFA